MCDRLPHRLQIINVTTTFKTSGEAKSLSVEETRTLSYLETFPANIKKIKKGASNFIQAVFKAWIMEKSQNNQKKGDKCLKAVMDRITVPRRKTFGLLFFFTTKTETTETCHCFLWPIRRDLTSSSYTTCFKERGDWVARVFFFSYESF